MMSTYYFDIAGFTISVTLPSSVEVGRLLPSFRPFRADGVDGGGLLFALTLSQAEEPQQMTLLEESENDMGRLRLYATPQGYRVEIISGAFTHVVSMDRRFASATASLRWEDRHAGLVLSSMLRVVYAQAVLSRQAVSIHAAAVSCGGKAYLFMGRSGTGKSTHASLWLRHVPGSSLLNDDNPVVRMIDGVAYAYGTPWSGKLPCYKPLSFPVGGMVRLSQADDNRFCHCDGVDAFVAIYPGCCVISQDAVLLGHLHDTLVSLAETVPVGTLDCRPDAGAAIICHRSLAGEGRQRQG